MVASVSASCVYNTEGNSVKVKLTVTGNREHRKKQKAQRRIQPCKVNVNVAPLVRVKAKFTVKTPYVMFSATADGVFDCEFDLDFHEWSCSQCNTIHKSQSKVEVSLHACSRLLASDPIAKKNFERTKSLPTPFPNGH